jgi:hypothetical protein
MKKINRNETFKNYKTIAFLVSDFQKEMYDEEYHEKNWFDALSYCSEKITTESFSVMVRSNNLNEHSKNLAEKLKTLLNYLNTEKLILISHLKIDFFGNLEHDYEKVVKSYSKLSEYFPEKTYNEAIEIETSRIDDFVEIFFWLERCDPSIPEYVFWFDINQKFCFYFCKYGNIHFIDFTNGKLISDQELENLGFEVKNYDQFGQNAIEGRQIKI